MHPLTKFPGPKIRAISHLPTAFHSWRGQEPRQVLALHERYGPVVRITPDTLSFTSGSAWKDIYARRGAGEFERKDNVQLRPGVVDILAAKGHDHTRQRAALNSAFSSKALKTHERLVLSHVKRLVKRLQERADGHEEWVDIVRWFECTAFDIMGDLTLSTRFDCLAGDGYHPWVTILMNFFKAAAYAVNAKLFGPIMFPVLMLFAPIEDLQKCEMHVKMSAEKVQQRLSQGEDNEQRTDFWAHILRNKEHKDMDAMSVTEMEVNAAVLLIAGTETVATALTGAMWHLSTNPDTLHRVRQQIDAAFANEDDIDIAGTANIPYLTAIIAEALRIYPPFGGINRRETPAQGGMVSGWWVPGGTCLGVPQLASCLSSANFAKPFEFVPERWLNRDERPHWTLSDDHDACQPFSTGPKNCIGQGLAHAEMRLVLAHILWRFDWEVNASGFDPDKEKIFIVREKGPLYVRMKSREHTDKSIPLKSNASSLNT